MVKPGENLVGPTIPTLQWKSFDRIVQKCRVKSLFENIEGDSVLEVGTGEAHILRLAPGNYRVGIDLDMDYLKRGKKNHDIPVICSDAHKLPIKNNSFDCVLLPEIIEHLDDPKKAIAEARRVARKRVIITVPNKNRIWHSIGEVFDKNKLNRYMAGFKKKEIIPIFNDSFIRRNIWLNRLFGRMASLLKLDDFLVSRYEKSDYDNSVFLIGIGEL